MIDYKKNRATNVFQVVMISEFFNILNIHQQNEVCISCFDIVFDSGAKFFCEVYVHEMSRYQCPDAESHFKAMPNHHLWNKF